MSALSLTPSPSHTPASHSLSPSLSSSPAFLGPVSPAPATAGIGNFNNGFKVADDIRTLGAVPEDDSGDEREVVLDKHMALAMEERLLRGVEEELFREKKAMVKSFLKGDSVMGARRPLSAPPSHCAARSQCRPLSVAVSPLPQRHPPSVDVSRIGPPSVCAAVSRVPPPVSGSDCPPLVLPSKGGSNRRSASRGSEVCPW